jgi:hypothetical protein
VMLAMVTVARARRRWLGWSAPVARYYGGTTVLATEHRIQKAHN